MPDPTGDVQRPGTPSVATCPWCGYGQPDVPTDVCSECSCPTDPAAQRAYIHEREHAPPVQRAERWFRIGWRSFWIVALLYLFTILLGLWLTDTDRDTALETILEGVLVVLFVVGGLMLIALDIVAWWRSSFTRRPTVPARTAFWFAPLGAPALGVSWALLSAESSGISSAPGVAMAAIVIGLLVAWRRALGVIDSGRSGLDGDSDDDAWITGLKRAPGLVICLPAALVLVVIGPVRLSRSGGWTPPTFDSLHGPFLVATVTYLVALSRFRHMVARRTAAGRGAQGRNSRPRLLRADAE